MCTLDRNTLLNRFGQMGQASLMTMIMFSTLSTEKLSFVPTILKGKPVAV